MQVSRSILKTEITILVCRIRASSRNRDEEIIPGTHMTCVRKRLFRAQYKVIAHFGLRCSSLEGLHKQKQRTPISSPPLMLGIDGKDDMWETPHSAVSWMLSHPTVRGLPHSPFSHWLYPGSKLKPFSFSKTALLWNMLLCL